MRLIRVLKSMHIFEELVTDNWYTIYYKVIQNRQPNKYLGHSQNTHYP